MFRVARGDSANLDKIKEKSETKKFLQPNSSLKKKSYQELVVRYTTQKKILSADLIRAYCVLRYEFLSAFMIGITLPIGFKSNFNFFRLNPLVLTKEQSKKHPTLFLHGAFHNQGVWLYLAKALQSTDVGPLFTVNISSRKACMKDSFNRVYEEINYIQKLYRNHGIESISVNIVGYSLGAVLAYFVSLDKSCWAFDYGLPKITSSSWIMNPDIHTVVCIGNALRPLLSNMVEIVGEEDILSPPSIDETLKDSDKQLIIKCGHLNLIRSPILHAHIARILSQIENSKSSSEAIEHEHEVKGKNESELRLTPKKYDCLHRFFTNIKNKMSHSKVYQEKSPLKISTQSCIIF